MPFLICALDEDCLHSGDDPLNALPTAGQPHFLPLIPNRLLGGFVELCFSSHGRRNNTHNSNRKFEIQVPIMLEELKHLTYSAHVSKARAQKENVSHDTFSVT